MSENTDRNGGHTNHEPARDHLPAAPYLAGEGVIVPPVASSPAFSVRRMAQSRVVQSFQPKETQDAKYDLHPLCYDILNRRRRLERLAAKGAGHQPFLTIDDEAPSESVADEISDPILNTTGREQSRDLSTSYAPVVSGMTRASYANPSQAHTAPAIHGASR